MLAEQALRLRLTHIEEHELHRRIIETAKRHNIFNMLGIVGMDLHPRGEDPPAMLLQKTNDQGGRC